MASIIELNQGWSCIMTGINKIKKILEEEPETAFTVENQMTVYTTIYKMCTQKPPHNYSKEIYDKCREEIKNYNEHTVLPSLRKKHDECMLRELVKRWNNHKIMVGWLSHLFEYVDRYFVHQEKLQSLKESNLACFRNLVYHEIQSKVKDVALPLIHKEREGKQIDRALLQNVIDVYVENGMGELERYEKDFESFMLKDTASYYSRKASRWIQKDSCPDYMLKCENCLKKEKERVTHYLHLNTEPKLVEIVQNELLVVVAKQLLENEHSGCLTLLREGKMDDLSRMYRLYRPILQVLETIADIFKQVTAEGNALIKQAADTATDQAVSTAGVQEKVLRKVIELHDKYMNYVTQCFQNSSVFHKALYKSFEIFCNKTVAGDSFEKILATFCDKILTKGGGNETLSDEAIEQTLEKVTKLLAYISEKDLFAEFYRKNQARRLLLDRSVSEYHERSILTKFKQELDAQFTSKMEDMVIDMTWAKKLKKKFVEYLTPNIRAKLGFDLTVTVLNTNLWPSYKKSDVNLPNEMVKCVEVFNAFYETATKHHKLSWIYSRGTCLIVGDFDEKQIELTVSTYQATVLLLFNNTEKLSYTEILEQLNLSHEDLVKVLHSLSCTNYKILKKKPMSRTISITDTFEFNSKFTDKMQKIKVPFPLMDERKKVVEDVDNKRRCAIDAAIVRIMKSRKVLEYQQLVSECSDQLSRVFKPDIKMINKRTEELISREYLERDPQNPNNLKYLA